MIGGELSPAGWPTRACSGLALTPASVSAAKLKREAAQSAQGGRSPRAGGSREAAGFFPPGWVLSLPRDRGRGALRASLLRAQRLRHVPPAQHSPTTWRLQPQPESPLRPQPSPAARVLSASCGSARHQPADPALLGKQPPRSTSRMGLLPTCWSQCFNPVTTSLDYVLGSLQSVPAPANPTSDTCWPGGPVWPPALTSSIPRHPGPWLEAALRGSEAQHTLFPHPTLLFPVLQGLLSPSTQSACGACLRSGPIYPQACFPTQQGARSSSLALLALSLCLRGRGLPAQDPRLPLLPAGPCHRARVGLLRP